MFEADDPLDDTTLIINTPSGEWICNDDATFDTYDPMVEFLEASSGRYDIWVGSYSEGEYISGQLIFSEYEILPGQSGNGDSVVAETLNFMAESTYGVISLESGFLPDPSVHEALAGGSIDVSLNLGHCTGFAASSPDFNFYWSGSTNNLKIYFEADEPNDDTVLIINTPDGEWICNDDAYEETLNPMLNLFGYGNGRYDIWIGTYRDGGFASGKLVITELDTGPR